MPILERDDAIIHFEERGQGFPLLALAPGGMRSTIANWKNASLNPWSSYTGDFRVVSMDQRNSGASRGALDVDDPWRMYAADQLAVLDHLGVDRFVVLGCCIGCSFILELIEMAPERVAAAVLEQPIGVDDANRHLFQELRDSWAEELTATRDDLDTGTVGRFLDRMWGRDFVASVEPDAIARMAVDMLVLPGTDAYHPAEAGRRVADLAPAGRVLEPWKDAEHIVAATEAARQFLAAHAD